MNFTKQQLTAITQLGMKMAIADDRIMPQEMAVIVCELKHFGIGQDEGLRICEQAQQMPAHQAISIVSALSAEQKRRVAAYLGMIMAADGDIDDTEQAIWCLASAMCSLPEMTLAQARDIILKGQ